MSCRKKLQLILLLGVDNTKLMWYNIDIETQRRNVELKYKVIGSSNTENIIKTTLSNRGINNWKEYLNLNRVDDNEYECLDNINEAVECFASHVERGSEVGILFDTDT